MYAVIMAGGQGERFWPLSRENRPKQFLRLFGQRTLLQETANRLLPLLGWEKIFVVCGRHHAETVREQLPDLAPEQVIIEPVGRNTAPCIGLAALYLKERFPGQAMAVLPADHLIQDVAEFHRVLKVAGQLAERDWLVTFGIRPTYPATGYGYLQRGDRIGQLDGRTVYRVERFIEKPGLDKAQEYLRGRNYDWNSGMFFWTAEAVLREIQSRLPDLYTGLGRIGESDFQQETVSEVFPRLPSISIDYGIMEKALRVAAIPCSFGWSDVGSWRTLFDLWEGDEHGIASNHPSVAVDSSNVLVCRQGDSDRLTALLGVKDLIVVDTPDALLICTPQHSEEVRRIVSELKVKGRSELL